MNQHASSRLEPSSLSRQGKQSLVLALCIGLGLVTGCSASGSGTGDDSTAPGLTPEQGAANPTQPAMQPDFQPVTPQEPSEADSEEVTPDSGDVEPEPTPAPDPDPSPIPDPEPIPEPDPEPVPIPDPDPTPIPLTRVECDAAPSDIQTRMLELINETRATARNCGTRAFAATDPLVWNDTLERAAAGHSLDMSSINFFSHTGSNGSDIVARAAAVNYDYRNLGENLAAGQRTAAAAMQGLVDSPGHCANLMSPSYREVGVACSADSNSDYRVYWTQVFGRRQ